LYFNACAPQDRATVVIDNTDLGAPEINSRRVAAPTPSPAPTRPPDASSAR
jgi:hypothetical protein